MTRSQLAKVLVLATASIAIGQMAFAGTLDDIKASGSVSIGLAVEPPLTIMDGDGNLSGVVPDVTRAALKRMGIDKIEAKVTDWGALIPGLQAHRFDMISTGLYIREDRCQAILFAEPDSCSADVFVYKSTLPNPPKSYADVAANPSLKIAVAGGSSYEKDALSAGVSRDQLVMMNDPQGGVDLVLSGRADLFASPDLSSRAAVAASKTTSVAVEKIAGSITRCGASGFRKDDKEFRDAFDVALKAMKDAGEYATIANKYGFDAQLAIDQKRVNFCSAN